MRCHRIAAVLAVVLLVGACGSGGEPPEVDAAQQVVSPSAAPGASVPAAPDVVDAGAVNGAIVLSVARPHVSEAVEYYEVSVDGSTWRALEASEWQPARGGAGILVTLHDPVLDPGQAAVVRLRAVSLTGVGAASPGVRVSADAGGDVTPDGGVSVDSALGLGGPASDGTPSDPARQAIVIIVEVLAALGLVSIGIFIGRRLRRA